MATLAITGTAPGGGVYSNIYTDVYPGSVFTAAALTQVTAGAPTVTILGMACGGVIQEVLAAGITPEFAAGKVHA